jgi:hypothetical protein
MLFRGFMAYVRYVTHGGLSTISLQSHLHLTQHAIGVRWERTAILAVPLESGFSLRYMPAESTKFIM